ncbi:MAG: type II secretion system protein [Gammaproteobacteria bacterium]
MTGHSLAHRRAGRGFTLIELAMVIFVLALLFGGLIGPMTMRVEQSGREETEARMQEIKEALLGFAVTRGRLPCPDCPDGAGSCTGVAAAERGDGREDLLDCADGNGICAAVPAANRGDGNGDVCATNGADARYPTGALPFADLGVRAEDGWGRRYRYVVTASFSDMSDGAGTDIAADQMVASCSARPPAGVSFEICSLGFLNVFNWAAPPPDTEVRTEVAASVPVVVISFGANAQSGGALSSDEQDNQQNARDFVFRPYARDTDRDFDDMLAWVPATVLVNRMISAGRLP